jgi:hypothetical protein
MRGAWSSRIVGARVQPVGCNFTHFLTPCRDGSSIGGVCRDASFPLSRPTRPDRLALPALEAWSDPTRERIMRAAERLAAAELNKRTGKGKCEDVSSSARLAWSRLRWR